MDFIKQNLVIVACVAVVVLFLILGIPVLMWAGGNEQQQQTYVQQVNRAEERAGEALEAFGLVEPIDPAKAGQITIAERPGGEKQEQWILVRVPVGGEREKQIFAAIATLGRQLANVTAAAVDPTLRRWVESNHGDLAPDFRQHVATKLTSSVQRIMRTNGVPAAEAVNLLRNKVTTETNQLVNWEIPSTAGGEPEKMKLLIGYKAQLVTAVQSKQAELSTMRAEVAAEQIRRGGLNVTPLWPGVFPKPTSSGVMFTYKDKYYARITDTKDPAVGLPAGILAGRPYTSEELTARISPGPAIPGQAISTLRDFDPGNPFPGLRYETPSTGQPPFGSEFGPDFGMHGGVPVIPGGPGPGERKMTEQDLLQLDRARSPGMQIYLVNPETSLGAPEWVTGTTPPSLLDAWFGQVKLWIIEDLVGAVGKTNLETPQVRPGLTGNKFSVQQSIIKHLKGIRIGPDPMSVYAALGAETTGGGGPGMPAGMAPTLANPYVMPTAPGKPTVGSPFTGGGQIGPQNFTSRKPCAYYDVTYAGIRVVIDAREIRRLMAHIDENRFYTAIKVGVRDVDQKTAHDAGFWYGQLQPMADVTMVYEVLLFREVFENPKDNVHLIPDEVKVLFERAGAKWELPQPPR